ncbi:MAG: HNH endonuclease, partial [Deltaproteobacteria bacterium]
MTTTARVQAGRLADLLRRERAEMAEFLLALAEFDEQRGWLELGYSSLFYFLHRELGLSKGAAHYRKTA